MVDVKRWDGEAAVLPDGAVEILDFDQKFGRHSLAPNFNTLLTTWYL